jgi:hypothetical protein
VTIIAGGSRCNSRYFAWHLQRTDRGQTVAVRDVVGLMGNDMRDWFEQLDALAQGSRAKNTFYHFSLSPRRGEDFTDEQLRVGIQTTLRALGLEDQPYFVVQHGGKDGRPDHYHCIASRIDLGTGKAIPDSHNYDIHMRTAEQLEDRFGHVRTDRGRGPDGPNPKGYEVQRGRDTGIDPRDVGALFTRLWHTTDTGKALAAAIEDHGFILARGRRGFLAVDAAGDEHSLASRIAGAKMRDVKARMKDVDLAALPSVEEARETARERAQARDRPNDREPKAQTQPAPAPAQAPDRRSAFEIIAEKLMDAPGETIADEYLRGESAASTKPSEPLAREAATVAEEAAPGVLPELSAFERFTSESTEAARAAGGVFMLAEGLEWVARKLGRRSPETAAEHREPSPFDRFTGDATHAARENGGEPEQGFWARGAAMLSAARDRALAFARASARTFTGRMLRERNNHDKGLER